MSFVNVFLLTAPAVNVAGKRNAEPSDFALAINDLMCEIAKSDNDISKLLPLLL